jgi:hypothetical protein
MGGKGEDLALEMESEPVWSTLSRTAYRSRYQGSEVVVQVAREAFPESELAQFEAGIRYLGNQEVCSVADPRILAEFRQWLRQAESCATERSYLEVLGRARSQTLVAYPELIPEISTNQVLCWPWVEGEPLSSLIRRGSAEAVTQAAVAVLEQYCTLSLVDAELDWNAMVMPPGEERLTVRRMSRPIAVPASLVNAGMKYIAAVLEGHITVTSQTLVKLALGKSTGSMETSLLGFMSAVEPELKVGLQFPQSAATFEVNWRALAMLGVTRPLYLNCLHRNLIATGYWTAEAVACGGRSVDTITEAHWPVVKRLFTLSASRFLDPAVVTEWSVGLGLLGFGAMREANRLAEEVRDNNLTLEVDVGGGRKATPENAGRSFLSSALIGCLLIALLATLRWGGAFTHAAQPLVVAGDSIILLSLFWVVAKTR